MRKTLALLFVCSLFVVVLSTASCGGLQSTPQPLSVAEKKAIVQDLIQKRDFIGLFKRAEEISNESLDNGTHFIEDAVTLYVDACCRDKKSVVELLRRNGFDVVSAPYKGVAKPFNAAKERGVPYGEEIIQGEKKINSPLPIVWTLYKAFFYLENGRVYVFRAGVYRDSI